MSPFGPAGRAVTAVVPITDAIILTDGARPYARDLAFRRDRLLRALAAGKPGAVASRVAATVALIDRARAQAPGCVRFAVRAGRGGLSLTPLDWSPKPVRDTRTVRADVVVVGGEIESIVTAMAAADAGATVALVHAGPLGGLTADTGGNLRYFDCIPGTPHPRQQAALFRQGLGMRTGDWVCIPADTDGKIRAFLRRRYAGITALGTRSYNSLQIRKGAAGVSSITTEEGMRLIGAAVLDAEPEGIVAEKAGLPMSIDVPNLAYGLVFDVNGIRPGDWPALRDRRRYAPERILGAAGVTEARLAASADGREALRRMRRAMRQDHVMANQVYQLGYQALAQGFDLWMHCLAVRKPGADVTWLNARRCSSGFNVTAPIDHATFNSLSYRLDRTVLQHDHDLARDAEFAPIRATEGPQLEAYLRWVAGNPALRVRLPAQFYVRRASAAFATDAPYGPADFVPEKPDGLWMTYQMDYRNLTPRDTWDADMIRKAWSRGAGRYVWACRGSSLRSAVPNLYLLNRSGVPMEWYGGLRIVQGMVNTGAVWAAERPWSGSD
ncbi:MAG: hypothetical protein NT029_03595 [Armatimonadetes bacterium]|nr:hypothetical protein [Armatimonadota bacterium]